MVRTAIILSALAWLLLAACNSAAAPPETGGGRRPQPVAPAGIPKLEDVRTAEVHSRFMFPLPGLLRTEHAGHREIISRLIGWLGQAEEVARAPGEPPANHVRLVLHLKDHTFVVVRQAFDCDPPDTGTAVICAPAPDQVIFHPQGSTPSVRLRAPELAAWLRDGWKGDLPNGNTVRTTPIPLPEVTPEGITSARVHRMAPDLPEVWLDPQNHRSSLNQLALALAGVNQGLPRNEATTPVITVEVELHSGHRLALSYIGSDWVPSTLDGEPIWIESTAVAEALHALELFLEA